KKAPIPVSNSTVLPLSGLASSARQASGTRFCSSGASQLDHIARGALPNIAPASSFWELPRMDQSFMAAIVRPAGGKGLKTESWKRVGPFAFRVRANGLAEQARRYTPVEPSLLGSPVDSP